MTKTPSLPPTSATTHFRAAAIILRQDHSIPLRRTFPASARDIRDLCQQLIAQLENPASLREIDGAARALAAKCLEIQQLTLRARKDGVR